MIPRLVLTPPNGTPETWGLWSHSRLEAFRETNDQGRSANSEPCLQLSSTPEHKSTIESSPAPSITDGKVRPKGREGQSQTSGCCPEYRPFQVGVGRTGASLPRLPHSFSLFPPSSPPRNYLVGVLELGRRDSSFISFPQSQMFSVLFQQNRNLQLELILRPAFSQVLPGPFLPSPKG